MRKEHRLVNRLKIRLLRARQAGCWLEWVQVCGRASLGRLGSPAGMILLHRSPGLPYSRAGLEPAAEAQLPQAVPLLDKAVLLQACQHIPTQHGHSSAKHVDVAEAEAQSKECLERIACSVKHVPGLLGPRCVACMASALHELTGSLHIMLTAQTLERSAQIAVMIRLLTRCWRQRCCQTC